MMIVAALLCAFVALSAPVSGMQPFNVSTPFLFYGFDSTGNLTYLSASAQSPNLIAATPTRPLWSVAIVTKAVGTVVVSPAVSACDAASISGAAEYDILAFDDCPIPGSVATLSVHVMVIHPSTSPPTRTATMSMTASLNKASEDVSLWSAALSVAGLTAADDDTLFTPHGFGETTLGPAGSGYSAVYPSGGATMQFMAVGGGAAVAGQTAYVAMHDDTASMKTLSASVTTSLQQDAQRHALPLCPGLHDMTPLPLSARRLSTVACRPAGDDALAVDGTPSTALSFSFPLKGSGQPNFTTWTSPFLHVGAPQAGGWHSAATIYGAWARTAPWAAKGPIAKRPDFPASHLDTHVWVNSGWQCHDVFNDTQGDPNTVTPLTSAVVSRFGLASNVSLHWYEWQQGGTPRYRFDTHYPDYFPPRANFSAAVQALTAEGIYTFPYINGRIFDVNSDTYKRVNGSQYCTRSADPQLGTPQTKLYEESYGSGATFNVADPSTKFWQSTISGIVKELVQKYSVAGVYVDQIAAAAPTPDWTPSHGHFGGGSWWYDGQVQMFNDIQSGSPAPIVIESNAEPYLGGSQGYLTLQAFEPPTGGTRGVLTPAFPAVYGGLYYAFGAIFSSADFDGNADVYASKLAGQFTYGAALGWFSLSGGTNDGGCGDMGTAPLFLDPAHDAEVAYVRLLGNYRQTLATWLRDGRLQRPFDVQPSFPSFMPPTGNPYSKGPFASTVSAAWLSADGKSALLVMATASSTVTSAEHTLTFHVVDYFSTPPPTLVMHTVAEDGSTAVFSDFSVSNGIVTVSVTVTPRSVLALQVTSG